MKENSPRMRQSRKLERKAGVKPAYPRVLMVCEGSETEPNYLEGIRRHERIPTAHWKVLPSTLGTGPEKVVEFAEGLARSRAGWDEVYCIFDRDEHAHYREAVARAAYLNGKIRGKAMVSPVRFVAIPSVPCFELWFLVHFEAVTRRLERDEAQRNLQRQMPDYDKNLPDMFARTKERLESAYGNAACERIRKSDTGNDNPSTDVDILVKRLFEIAAMRNPGHLLLPDPA
jgi:hypothetical protein